MKFKILILTMLITLSSNPVKSQAELTGFASSMGVTAIIDELITGIEDIIKQLEVSASLLLFQTRTDLLFTAENLKRMALEFEGKLFEDLTTQQQLFFNNLNRTINDVKSGVTESIDGINQLVRITGTEAGRIIGVDDNPLLYSLEPGYIMHDTSGKTLFKFKGSSLGKGDISMNFGQQYCTLLSRTEIEIKFQCANNSFDTNDWQTGNMKIEIDEPWYNLFKSDRTFIYPVSVKAIPKKMGDIELKYFIKEVTTTRERRQEPQARRVGTGDCGSTPAVWSFSPQTGCKIDPTSINVNQGPTSSRSVFHGLRNPSENGFQIHGHAFGSGEKVLGKCVGGGRGVVMAHPVWHENCTREVTVEKDYFENDAEKVLNWGNDRSFSLPQGTIGYNLVVTQVNGQIKSIASHTEITDWFTVNYNPNSKVLVIKPKDIRQVTFD